MKKYKRQFAKKLIPILILFLPPALLCGYWYKIEYQEIFLFENFELKGQENISPETANDIYYLTSSWYDSTKDIFPVKFRKEESNSDFNDFENRVSESITERLGIFSHLPYHKACLFNRNEVYIDGVMGQAVNSPVAVKQRDGYDFYVERGGKDDCKNILINKFRYASSSPEFGYPVVISINQEEDSKRLKGENYLIDLATTSVEATNTSIIISLHWWTPVLAYLLFLFAWSFVFFQYEKIFKSLHLPRRSE